MNKNLEKYIDDFFNSIPQANLTEEEWKKCNEQQRKEDIKFYSNRDEKGYAIN